MVSNNRLQSIWTGLARSVRYIPYVEEQDISSFLQRSGCEGPEYYARGFTSLRQSLLTGIETGVLNVKGRFGLKRGTSLPRFLFRAWSAVFNEDGTLRDDHDTGAVSCLNQLLAVFGKINGGHTPQSEKDVLESFVLVEETLRDTPIDLEAPVTAKRNVSAIMDQASKLVRRVLAGSDPRDIHPRHGSGVSACGTLVRDRYSDPRHIEKLDAMWPMTEYYYLNLSHVCDKVEAIVNRESYVPRAKVILVPKDARGPRLISCEPRETMWIQQGLMMKLYNIIESHKLTRRSVNFTDQTHNQRAVYYGSINRRTASLDLSEASDRLRLDVVMGLFPENWADALCRCRSESTELPDGRVVYMRKHAPMGSAVCFPVMALCIWAILTAALPQGCKILVYGDDIIVPTRHAELAMKVLELFHLKVNRHKSFVQGPFRESCGKEYINGVDITPVRLRMNPLNDSTARARTIAFANNLSARFGSEQLWLTELIRTWYRKVPVREHDFTKPVKVAQSVYTDQGLQVTSSSVTEHVLSNVLNVALADNSLLRSRWNRRLFRREYRFLVCRPIEQKYSTGDWCHLFRAVVNPRREDLLLNGEIRCSDFGSDALAKRVSFKYRWAPL